MPLPAAAFYLAATGGPVVINTGLYIFTGLASVAYSVKIYFDGERQDNLPTFHETAKEAAKSARADIDALAMATSEHLHQVELDTMQQNARIDEASANYEMKLITMERGTVQLDEAVTVVVESREESTGELQRVIEAQVETQARLEAQQTMVQSIAASLENLPELLQSNREKQALRVEHARLLLEKESYTSRANMLLGIIKEKDEVNERLQVQVDTLEAKFSGLVLQMEKVLAFAQGKQREVNELREQLNEQGAENKGTHFSLNLFA